MNELAGREIVVPEFRYCLRVYPRSPSSAFDVVPGDCYKKSLHTVITARNVFESSVLSTLQVSLHFT